MAEKQAGGLSLRIGLTLSQLQSDFLQAEQTVRQGIAALNRQQNIVRLRMETDVAGLDSFADKTKIIEVREQALNQLLGMQRDRLTLATKAFQDYSNSEKAHEAESKRLETAMERERLAVARLESELKNLSAQKVSIDVSGLQSNIDKISARIQNIRLKAEVDTSQLQGANTAFDAQKIHIAAVTKELELQRRKLAELQEVRRQTEKASGRDSVQTINIKSNILQQIQEINRLETKLKELKSTDINLQFRSDSLRNVENAIRENIARINARIENIRIKSEIDISKLGTAASEFDKAKVHVAALNQELALQKQKLAELQAAMYNSAKLNGSNSSQTIKLRGEVLQQIQTINQLKAKIEELNEVQPPKSNLLSSYLNIKGDITGKLNQISSAFSGIASASQSADGAITKSLEIISAIPSPVGKAVATLALIPLVFTGIEKTVVDMLRATASAGDSVYVMSRGFQMSIADTGKFTSMCKTAGVEVNDLAQTIRRTQQQIIRGGDNAKAENWLKRYGESAFDAGGHLKNMNEMTLALSRALKRAQAEGNGMAFILATMRTASADAITAIEDAEGVYKQAAGLVKNGLANPTLAHEVQGNINALNLQSSFMSATFKSALLPVANEIVPRLTERMGNLTKVIADNKDVILDFGRAGAEAFLKIEAGAEAVIGAIGSVAKFFSDLKKNPREQEIIEKYKYDTDIKTVDDLIKKEQPKAFDVIKENPRLYWQVKGIYEPLFKALNDVQEEIKRKNKDLAEEVSIANFSSIGQERKAIEQNPELLENLRKARKIQEEADAILYKLNHSDYENKTYDAQKRRSDALRESESSIEEREAVEKRYSAEIAQIEQERADKISEIRKNANEEFKSGIDARIDKINEEKDAWISAGMDSAEAMELSQKRIGKAMKDAAKEFESEVERIKGEVQSLEDKVFEQEHSQYQNDLRKLQQEYVKLYEEGSNSPEMIERYYHNALKDLNKRAAKDKSYRKSPEGSMERGGNGIQVISGDKIVDDGLIQSRQKEIGLLADENQIRMQLLQKQRQELSGDTWAMLAQQVQKNQQQQINLPQQQVTQPSGGIQIIEGDRLISNQPLQEFGYNLEQLNNQMRQIPTLEKLTENQPIESFQSLKNSTEGLTNAQNILAGKLREMSEIGIQSPVLKSEISMETVVVPLNNIATIAQNILSAIGNAKQAEITVSPSIRIDLGGAYVFDNRMKKDLTDDITKEIVEEITKTVSQATRRNSYGYGA